MGQGLEGVKVLELGGGVSAPMACKLLADLGATVVKIEPPEGDPDRRRGPFRHGQPDPEASGVFLVLNTNKRSVVLDLATEGGQAEFEALAAGADLVIHNLTPREMAAQGVDYARLSARNPRLVMVSITPFGLTGPYRDYVATDLTVFHGGGWGYLCPGSATDPDPNLPPIKPFGQHALIQAGYHAALAAMAGHYGARATGRGDHIDLSAQAVMAAYTTTGITTYTYTGKVETRLRSPRSAPNSFYRCRDGQVYIVCLEEDQWARLVEVMGNPEWARRPEFKNRELRGDRYTELDELINAWSSKLTVEQMFHACQQRRICACPLFSYDQILHQEHLLARGAIVEQEHPVAGKLLLPGAPALLKHPWWALRRPTPRLGEANGEARRLLANGGPKAAGAVGAGAPLPRPLAGVRVLDFTWVWAGPYCALLLASLGAEVLKVESPDRSDLSRRGPIVPPEMERGVNRSGQFNERGQGKLSVSINLSRPEGVELIKRLLPHCDAVVSNFSSGVLERRGLGPDEMFRLRPDLIIGAISGFGQTGPDNAYIGYGAPITALTGISASTGYPGGPPERVGIAYGDPNAGILMAFALAAALVARSHHGGGQYIDMSLWEALNLSGFEGWINHVLGQPPYPPMGNHDPVLAPYNVYRCRGDDEWVSISCAGEGQWQALCGAMGRPELARDPRFVTASARKAHEDELDALIGRWCAPQERWAVTAALQAVGVPAFPSMSAKDLFEDPQLNARGYFSLHAHPEVGTRAHPTVPWLLANRPNGTTGRAPLLGEHTDEVLGRLLHLSRAELARLHAEHVIGAGKKG
ncbi:MAG: CoA transferase [Candidatus Lambdaproteobacteria bacterium]|nr:CoA transferase [Candidatus Lambdaproteobacteria bacterium]